MSLTMQQTMMIHGNVPKGGKDEDFYFSVVLVFGDVCDAHG